MSFSEMESALEQSGLSLTSDLEIKVTDDEEAATAFEIMENYFYQEYEYMGNGGEKFVRVIWA